MSGVSVMEDVFISFSGNCSNILLTDHKMLGTANTVNDNDF